MRVFKCPRSPYYYFDFDLGGTTHVKSTRLKNERQALDYAAAYRLKLIKRSGYGRMKLDLLRQRVLYHAA